MTHYLGILPSVVEYVCLRKLVQGLSTAIGGGWGRRTITKPTPDGQNEDGYNQDQSVSGDVNSEATTKLKNEEHQNIGEEGGHHTPISEAPVGPGGAVYTRN